MTKSWVGPRDGNQKKHNYTKKKVLSTPNYNQRPFSKSVGVEVTKSNQEIQSHFQHQN